MAHARGGCCKSPGACDEGPLRGGGRSPSGMAVSAALAPECGQLHPWPSRRERAGPPRASPGGTRSSTSAASDSAAGAGTGGRGKGDHRAGRLAGTAPAS
eukprot:4600375-Pyramimonas_sp.AAC.1